MAWILGHPSENPSGGCFTEICDAVSAITVRPVVFCAERFEAPDNVILYNWENQPVLHESNVARACEIWDFSTRNVSRYSPLIQSKIRHVPCGYHPTMERFVRATESDIDVLFTGSMNDRRRHILDALIARGLYVVEIAYALFGPARDAFLARTKVVLNMRFYEDGVFPVLRCAHAMANRIVCINETSLETPWWAGPTYSYDQLTDAVEIAARKSTHLRNVEADDAYERFRTAPLMIPTERFS